MRTIVPIPCVLALLVAACRALPAADDAAPEILADVVSVRVEGEAGAYRFAVGIASPDQGCEQYADWWEVVSPDGELIHRRVLRHSHAGEQPFVRSGGPIPLAAGDVVWVRAHMHPTGYGGRAFRGSAGGGFHPAELPASFAAELETAPPQPPPCAW